MKLQFLGATGTVSGSKYLLEHDTRKVLVDCGLFQGYKQLRLRNWAPLPVDPKTIDAVVLTHAHIDHSGYLPLLVRNGFRGHIYCTAATRDLCGILLPDSGRLQEEEAEYANRRGFSRHKPAQPLYTEQDALRCLKQFSAQEYDHDIDLGGRLGLRLLPSGHLLGSAFVQLSADGKTIVFSGDLGRPDDAVMPPPARIARADYLVIESTYGNRSHDPADPRIKLAEVINRTAGRKGVVVIPAFAVGRTQTLLYDIHRLKAAGTIADIPVYLNSPMATDSTRLFESHRSEHRLDREQTEAMCRAAHIINTVEESKALNRRKGPMIIIAGSGMATGGRVTHHLAAFAPDPANTILFTGHQAGGTRGARMVAGETSIKIHGEMIPVRAEVAMINNLSAHADANEIIAWLRGFEAPPQRMFITHGEPGPADALRQRIEHELHWDCEVPEYLETAALE
jgi:metallo-beta-lactamase family protein